MLPYYPTDLLGNSCDLLINSLDHRHLAHSLDKDLLDDKGQLTVSNVVAESQIYGRDEFVLSLYLPEKDTCAGLEIEYIPHVDSSTIPLPTLEPTIDTGSSIG